MEYLKSKSSYIPYFSSSLSREIIKFFQISLGNAANSYEIWQPS